MLDVLCPVCWIWIHDVVFGSINTFTITSPPGKGSGARMHQFDNPFLRTPVRLDVYFTSRENLEGGEEPWGHCKIVSNLEWVIETIQDIHHAK